MTVRDGFPSATGLADALDVRLDLAGLVVRDTSGNPRTGVFPRTTTALVTSTATMNSSVGQAEFITARTGQGPVFLANDGATNVLHDAAPVANSRYDIIYVKQSDTSAGDGVDTAAFGIFKGTASASPTPYTYATAKAAIPTGAEPLAMVLIPSTATSMQSGGVVYTQLHRFTACSGGVLWFRDTTDRDAVGYARGQIAYLIDTNQMIYYSGSAWVPFLKPYAVSLRKSANQNLTTSLAALTWDVEISDPAGMHDNSSNTSRLVAVEAGLYEVCASLYNNNTSGLGNVEGRLNGTTTIPGSFDRRTGDGGGLPLKSIFSVVLAAGDYIEIMVQHATAAGAIEGGTTRSGAVVTMKRVGP